MGFSPSKRIGSQITFEFEMKPHDIFLRYGIINHFRTLQNAAFGNVMPARGHLRPRKAQFPDRSSYTDPLRNNNELLRWQDCRFHLPYYVLRNNRFQDGFQPLPVFPLKTFIPSTVNTERRRLSKRRKFEPGGVRTFQNRKKYLSDTFSGICHISPIELRS